MCFCCLDIKKSRRVKSKKYACTTSSGAVIVTAKNKKEALERLRKTVKDARLKDVYRY